MRCGRSTNPNAWSACLALLAATTAILATLLSCVAPQALAAGDANTSSCPAATEFAAGFSASLPDCRAYELVTEADSGDLLNIEHTYGFPDHFMYASILPTPGEATHAGLPEQFLATRTAQGWRQTPLTVPQGEGPLSPAFTSGGVMFTGDFADALLMEPFQDASESPRLDETTGTMVYELSLTSGAISTVSLPDSGTLTQSTIEFPAAYKEDDEGELNGWGSYLAGASEDGSRVFFSTSAKLATAPGTPQDTHQASAEVYERTGGHTYLVGVLPDGEVPVCGAEVGQNDKNTGSGISQFYSDGAIAPDGSNVVFHAPGENARGATCTERETGVFLRDVVSGTTVKLPGALYAGRTGTRPGEEEKIFTVEPGAEQDTGKIFEYHVSTKQTVEIAAEADGLLAYSADGSRVYYLGPKQGIYLYEEGAPTPVLIPGSQEAGRDNTFYDDNDEAAMVATHDPTEWLGINAPVVTSNGEYLMFMSASELTPYQNCVESEGEERCHVEVYLYDAGTGHVTCLSCGPAGSAPRGTASFIPQLTGGPGESANWVPPAPPLIDSRPAEGGKEAVMRAVFQTTESLVPQDTDGTWDVYEWEQEETEGCSRASLKLASLTESQHYSAAHQGCLYMLSSGTGRELKLAGLERTDAGSHLLGASEGLTDIYIETVEPLTGSASLDNVAHVYDVRQDGGFPALTTATRSCEPGLCRPEGEAPPVFGEPGSVAFTGAGDLKPATVKPKPKASLTRKQKLARARNACKRRKGKRRRAACQRKARSRYGARPRRSTNHSHRGGAK